jgi:predicted RNase H-like HicB family nuclease
MSRSLGALSRESHHAETDQDIVEKHLEGYIAYPVGLKGVVVAEGDTYEEALADARSAIAFHVETFGPEVLEEDELVLEVFIAEAGITV